MITAPANVEIMANLGVAVGTDDGVHGLPEHIERNAQRDIEEVFLRVAEGLLIHRAAEHGDDGVCENEVYRRQNKTADADNTTALPTLRLALSTSFLPSAMLTKAQQPSPNMTAIASATTVSGNTTVLAALP